MPPGFSASGKGHPPWNVRLLYARFEAEEDAGWVEVVFVFLLRETAAAASMLRAAAGRFFGADVEELAVGSVPFPSPPLPEARARFTPPCKTGANHRVIGARGMSQRGAAAISGAATTPAAS